MDTTTDDPKSMLLPSYFKGNIENYDNSKVEVVEKQDCTIVIINLLAIFLGLADH